MSDCLGDKDQDLLPFPNQKKEIGTRHFRPIEVHPDFSMVRLYTCDGCPPRLICIIGKEFVLKITLSSTWLHSIATQNVDGFPAAAGSHAVVELHGNIRSIRCHRCKQEAKVSDFLNRHDGSFCRGPLRPNVVLFGEMLSEKAWNQAKAMVSRHGACQGDRNECTGVSG